MSHCPSSPIFTLKPGQNLSNCDLTGNIINPESTSIHCTNWIVHAVNPPSRPLPRSGICPEGFPDEVQFL